jgi:hypothetical protein
MNKAFYFLLLFFIFQNCTEEQPSSSEKNSILMYYEKLEIIGFQVFVRKDANKYSKTKQAIQLLTHDLIVLKHLVSPKHFAFFQKVKIWIEWNSNTSKAIHYINSLSWIKRNNYPRKKLKSIEILSIKNYLTFSCLQPYMLLHEFAHAYHHQVIGYEDNEITENYCIAMEKKLYDSVAYIQPMKKKKKVRAYAAQDVKEYFAELTESFLGLNDYFPFDKNDLQKYDTIGFRLVKKHWAYID